MKKTYIAPVSVEHKVMLTSLIAESLRMFSDDELNGENALGNEDFGWGDDDPASWNWKNN